VKIVTFAEIQQVKSSFEFKNSISSTRNCNEFQFFEPRFTSLICTVPADWRITNIFALHKKGPKDLAKNYHPISLTSVCCKTLEHIVYSNVCNNNNILTPKQHGFRPGFSCETQLILSINDWARSLDSGFRTDVAIFDFSKVFNSVPHTRLLGKLHYYGIRCQMLFLLNRYQ